MIIVFEANAFNAFYAQEENNKLKFYAKSVETDNNLTLHTVLI
jgi:hypothetical protein